jgi:hypothetical protein
MNKTGLEKMVEWLEGKIDLDTYDSDIAKTHLLKARQLLASEATTNAELVGLEAAIQAIHDNDGVEPNWKVLEALPRYRPVVKEQGEAWSCKTCANKGIKCQECVKTTMCGTPAFYKEQGEAGLDRHGRVVTAEALSDALSSPAPVASGLVEELKELERDGIDNPWADKFYWKKWLRKIITSHTTNQDEKGETK